MDPRQTTTQRRQRIGANKCTNRGQMLTQIRYLGQFLAAICIFHGGLSSAQTCQEVFQSNSSLKNAISIHTVVFSPPRQRNGSTTPAFNKIKVGSKWANDNRALAERELDTPKSSLLWEDPGFLVRPEYLEAEGYTIDLLLGLSELHAAYRDSLSEAEVRLTQNLDTQEVYTAFAKRRAGFFIARLSASNQLAALARVYDGTPRQAGEVNRLPTEELQMSHGTKTHFFDQLRSEGFDLKELGKYFLKKDLTSVEKSQLKLETFKWFYANYLAPEVCENEKTIFIIDAVSPAHARAYRSFYGAVEVDAQLFTPSLDKSEILMMVPLPVLRKKIADFINRP